MRFNIYYRGKTTEPLEKTKDLNEGEVLQLISELLDKKEIIKLKIVKSK